MLAFRSQGPPGLGLPPLVRPERVSLKNPQGFTLMELMVVMAVIGIITVTAIPTFLSFIQAQKLRGAAQQVTSLLNHARQLAIARNTSFCVQLDAGGTRLRFFPTSNCTGTAYAGPGTDNQGFWQLDSEIQLINQSGTNPAFTSLGAATTAGTMRVKKGTSCLDVIVSLAGRVRTASVGAC